MPESNCSLAALAMTAAKVFNHTGCPEIAVMCGMNISWVLANSTEEDVKILCLSEDKYFASVLGPVKSPVFLPVCISYSFIFIVGVSGNSSTCAVILRYKVMQTPTNYYSLSSAVSDSSVSSSGMPLELYDMQQNYPSVLGEGACYFKIFSFETVCFASILNVTALSVERYVAVVHPLKVKYLATRAHVKRVILVSWGSSMVCAVPNASSHGIVTLPPQFGREFPRSAMCASAKPVWVYNSIISISTSAFFALPLLIISILYSLIGSQSHREKVRNSVAANDSLGPDGLSRSHKQRSSKRNSQVTKMLCVSVIVFSLCWAPFHVDRLMYSYIDVSSAQHQLIFESVHIVSGVCFYSSSAVNPILYNSMSTRFRERFGHITCHSKGCPARSRLEMTRHGSLREEPHNSKKWT